MPRSITKVDRGQAITFERWLRVIDVMCESKLGCSMHDLSDWPSRATYDEGASVREGFETLLEWCGEDSYFGMGG